MERGKITDGGDASGDPSLLECIRRRGRTKQANDRLAPIRRAKQGLLEHGVEELAGLDRLWRAHDIPALKSALRAYHERRKQLVPSIVALLSDRSDYLH
jgi:hypothetical protein